MTPPPAAVALDALADTRRLWEDWLQTAAPLLGHDPAAFRGDRGEAADRLDELGAGNWRALLERFAEERAPVYLRRDAAVASALRSLAAAGSVIGVFTDAPEPLARVALAHLGADRRVAYVESGSDALTRLRARLGADTVVLRTRAELLDAAAVALG